MEPNRHPAQHAQPSADRLRDVYQECREQDWDGYDALPVSEATFTNATTFLQLLPTDLAAKADPGAEPDGNLTLEWYIDTDYQISISIDAQSRLHFAAAVGPRRKRRGTDTFSEGVPQDVVDIITEVLEHDRLE
ncbi:MAG: hypothetical protein R6W89_08205 [Candidatus Hydrogenedentota bacterium]